MLNSSEIQSLNELEMSVYNYVTAHQEEVAHIKIRDLANAAYVSTSTVLRFARKWDVTALQYQESLQLSPRSYDGSEIRDFFKRNDTPEFQAQVEKMANVLQSAKVVIFVGIGNSAMTAQYAARYFANSGKFSVCIVDPFNQIGVDSRCKKGRSDSRRKRYDSSGRSVSGHYWQ